MITVSVQSASKGDCPSRARDGRAFSIVGETFCTLADAIIGKSSTKANATNTPTNRINDPTDATIQ